MNPKVRESALAETAVEALASQICGDTNSFTSLLDSSTLRITPDALFDGCLIQGNVVDIRETNILIDFGFKSEGILPFKDGDRVNDDLDIGDCVSAVVSEITDDETIKLTRQNIEEIETKIQLIQTLVVGQRLSCNLVATYRDGWVADIGVSAILPYHQSGISSDVDLATIPSLEVQIESIDADGVITLTRKPILDEVRKSAKESFLTNLQPGTVVPGTVRNVTDFGAFVQIASGVIGLCHASDMGSDPIQVGQQILVKVLKYDRDKNRVSLGIRQVKQPSWEQVVQKYHVNDKVIGQVTSLTSYGAFIEIEPGVQGLVHISDLSWSDHIKHPKDLLSIGETAEVIILEIEADKKRLSLGIKQVNPDPWDLVSEKYLSGSTVTGKVVNKTHFGVFIELEKGIDGLASGVKGANLEVGDVINVNILKVDARNRRISLGL